VIADGLTIRRNAKGRAVYATRAFRRGERVSECTMLVWPKSIKPDRFVRLYVWEWIDTHAICLGIASLFNHGVLPNTGSQRLYDSNKMAFNALRDIARGEEILVDYGEGASAFKVIP